MSFNTQPPEGGWLETEAFYLIQECFNTQPPEGGWTALPKSCLRRLVSTHSRPKAAGFKISCVTAP